MSLRRFLCRLFCKAERQFGSDDQAVLEGLMKRTWMIERRLSLLDSETMRTKNRNEVKKPCQ